MFFIFFLNLSLFLNLGLVQAQDPMMMNPDEIKKAMVPQAKPGSPVQVVVITPKPVVDSCQKYNIPAGCSCDASNPPIKINCQCQEIYKKMVYFSNSFIKYSKKRECMIDYFPGCSPLVLPEGVNQPCEKLKRIVPKLAPTIRAEDFAKFCLAGFQQKVDISQGTNPINITCLQASEYYQAQVFFLP